MKHRKKKKKASQASTNKAAAAPRSGSKGKKKPSLCHVLDAEFVAAATQQSGLPAPAFAEIAFAGRSNVGKSSLINRILGRHRLVRTSSRPGCTRGLALFRARLRIGGSEADAMLDLVDLPGYGYARRSKVERRSWGPMIEGFLQNRVGLRAVVLIVDIRRGPEEQDFQLLEFLEHLNVPCVVVATKLDKLPGSQHKPALAKLSKLIGTRIIGFSASEGIGVDPLWHRVLDLASMLPMKPEALAPIVDNDPSP